MSRMIEVKFLDGQKCQIPLTDLIAVCGVGSDYAIPIPVASKQTFDKFQTYVNLKNHPAKRPRDGDDYVPSWDQDYIEEFRDKKLLKDLSKLAELTGEARLKHLCITWEGKLSFGGVGGGEGDEHDSGDDDKGEVDVVDDDYYSEDDDARLIMKKSPSPDTLPGNEDAYWQNQQRENNELYGEDRESASPENGEYYYEENEGYYYEESCDEDDDE